MNQNLIKKIQEKIKLQSVNSLGNLYPEDIIDWLEVSEEETKELIEFLHSQRTLFYKYRKKCDCSERITIYEHQLIRGKPIYCDLCGHEFSREEIEEKAEIIYEIDKEELLNLEDKKTEFRVFPTLRPNIVPMTQKQEEVEVMEVFMGSSSDAKDYMDEIAVKLEELGVNTLPWYASGKGIFIPSDNTIDALIKITKRVQAAVFIFNADDKVWNDKSALEISDAVRDNVLFEYGLFTGALGKENVCFVCKGKPKLATDLRGITYIDGDMKDALIKAKLKDWIEAIK